ncbi:MAG: NUDIX domain-containing protein [Pseudorhodoplanes sp.]|jgi:8-oxo-dGTP pyrophosphatase MutT (NUDIX family)|nr:NUDIX domain-containing protein [Pseudorhodoplanes sp.]
MIRRLMHIYWRHTRGLTLGVRGLVLNGEGRVFLIKHSYVPGWHLPGGGVEPGETLLEALTRELMEEGNIAIRKTPELYAMYYNDKDSNRDHVALYVIEDFAQDAPPEPNHEIVAHGFFAPGELPEDTSPATRARLNEVLSGAKTAERW